MKTLTVFLCVVVCSLLAAAAAMAQIPTGGVAGIVYDPTKAVVPGAQVTLRDAQTAATRQTATSAEGYYQFPLLRPSTYELTVEFKGFQRMLQRNIVVNAGEIAHVDVTLQLGDTSQTVEVTAGIPLIEPDKISISRAVDIKAIMSLTMLGRQINDLALTVPGTSPGAPGTQVVAFAVAGMRTQSNNYTLDGISNNDPQVNGPLDAFRITDAIQEFNVQTSIASADVGRSSGAQVSIITKSGGNSYHGSVFYYSRNDALDANDFFLNRAGQPKNALSRHQFGGTAGGYILKDKTFWFFSYEGFRQNFEQPLTARVPTDAERNAVTDPVSLAVLKFYPRANTPFSGGPGVGPNFTGTTVATTTNDTYLWRIDQKLTNNHHLSGRYAWFRGFTDSLQSAASPFNGNITNHPGQHSFVLQETWVKSRFVNEAKVGYSRNRTFFAPTDVSLNPAKIFTDAAGNPLPGFVDTAKDPLDGGLPNITIAGFAGLGTGTNMPQGRATNTYQAIDNVSVVSPFGWSRHTLRFGGEYRHEITNRFLNGNYRGQISFACLNAVDLRSGDPNAQAPCSPNRSLAAGKPQRGSLRTGEGGTFRTWGRGVWYLYAQDTFKAKPNLTINYGIRWEDFGAMREKYDRGSNFVPGIGVMALNSNLRIDIDPTALGRAALILTPVSFKLSRSGQRATDLNNFAPFLGIAYSPKFWRGLFGDGKTVIRTGFRLSYDDVFANIPVNMGLNAPQVLTTTLPTGTYSWGTVLNQNRSLFNPDPTVPQGARGIVSFNAWQFNPATAYAMNYALEVERQIGNAFAAEVSYVGSQGRKLGVFVDPNQPTVTVNAPTVQGDSCTPPPTVVCNVRVFPFIQYAGIGLGSFTSNSNYNGMVATLRKRPSHGLSFSASYEFGKTLDDNSSFFGSTGDFGSYADTKNRRLDYGRSGFDVQHRFSTSFIYDLPFGRNRVIGGWSIAGIVSHSSGFPFTIFAGTSFDYSGLNQFGDRPNWAPGIPSLPTNNGDPSNAFGCHSGAGNCPVFTQPPGGQTGNVSRNLFEGPGQTNVDFAAMKSFAIGESRRIQFRADFFNLFNHPQFNLPSSNIQFQGGAVTSSTVGTIGSDSNRNPRLIQLALRFDW